MDRFCNSSVIYLHRIQTVYQFDWEGAEILDEKHSYLRRLTLEMIYIKKENRKMLLTNKMTQTYYLKLMILSYL